MVAGSYFFTSGPTISESKQLSQTHKQAPHMSQRSYICVCFAHYLCVAWGLVRCSVNKIYIKKRDEWMQRFLPSEFGTDPARMADALEPGRVTFEDKMVVRKAIQDAGIPFTYISANCFAGYFVGGLCQPGRIMPSRESVCLFGDGDVKAIYVDEDDIATYTIKTIDDPRTLNKTLYLRPPENILSQREVVMMWEKLIGKELEKTSISTQEFLAQMKGQDYAQQVGLVHYYHVCFDGCLTNFEIGDEGEEASQLYPEVNYTRVKDYLKRYL